jgi:protein-L-isoaspartate(D-aspartate) O-methyltransferase
VHDGDQRTAALYAEEIEATANIQSAAIVDALATVPREQFLGPGPWLVRGEGGLQTPPRTTSDGDPRHVYHNLAVAIDPRGSCSTAHRACSPSPSIR